MPLAEQRVQRGSSFKQPGTTAPRSGCALRRAADQASAPRAGSGTSPSGSGSKHIDLCAASDTFSTRTGVHSIRENVGFLLYGHSQPTAAKTGIDLSSASARYPSIISRRTPRYVRTKREQSSGQTCSYGLRTPNLFPPPQFLDFSHNFR